MKVVVDPFPLTTKIGGDDMILADAPSYSPTRPYIVRGTVTITLDAEVIVHAATEDEAADMAHDSGRMLEAALDDLDETKIIADSTHIEHVRPANREEVEMGC